MTNNEFKIAIIGAGFMAKEHIKVFSSMKDLRVVGIYSRTESVAKEVANQFNIPIVATSISDLYEKTKADLLLVAVSEMSVYSVALNAFKYPWLSLIEKPAGYNFDNALLIGDLASKFKAKVFVSFNRRFFNSTSSVLGELNNDEGQRLIEVCDQEEPLLLDRPPEVHRNWMYANSIHVIDYLNILGRGEITKVIPIIHWNPDNPRYVLTKIEYSSGDIGIYKAIWNAPGPWAVSVTTQQKRWELKPLERATVQLRGSRKTTTMTDHPWEQDFKPGLRMQAEEVLKELNDKSSSLVSLDDSIKTMQLIKKIYEV